MLANTATSLFFLATAAIVYVVAIYPLFLHFLAHFFGKPVRKNVCANTVSVIVPVRNGAPWILQKLNSILGQSYPRNLIEIIVISDGSDDETDEIVTQFAPKEIRLLRQVRSGKPTALNRGIAASSGEILLLTDARQALAPNCIEILLRSFADPHVGAVSGDLQILKGKSDEEKTIGIYWRYERWIRSNLGLYDSTLGATGPIYAIRRELVNDLPADVILDDVCLPATALLKGYRIAYEESAIAFDYPTALSSEFRRKVRTQAGNYQIMWCCPGLLGFRNRMWFHYYSLKVGRLALPWFFILAALTTPALPQPAATAAVGAQAMFYIPALLDPWISSATLIKRLSSSCRTVAGLLLASLLGLSILVKSPSELWKETVVSKPEHMDES